MLADQNQFDSFYLKMLQVFLAIWTHSRHIQATETYLDPSRLDPKVQFMHPQSCIRPAGHSVSVAGVPVLPVTNQEIRKMVLKLSFKEILW